MQLLHRPTPARPEPAGPRAVPPIAWHTWTLTAPLLAARRELDGTITLAIADPDGLAPQRIVAFPGPDEPVTTDPLLCRRVQESRATFLTDFVDPSVEGFALLYGTASLTLARAAAGDDADASVPRIVGFTALGGAPR